MYMFQEIKLGSLTEVPPLSIPTRCTECIIAKTNSFRLGIASESIYENRARWIIVWHTFLEKASSPVLTRRSSSWLIGLEMEPPVRSTVGSTTRRRKRRIRYLKRVITNVGCCRFQQSQQMNLGIWGSAYCPCPVNEATVHDDVRAGRVWHAIEDVVAKI